MTATSDPRHSDLTADTPIAYDALRVTELRDDVPDVAAVPGEPDGAVPEGAVPEEAVPDAPGATEALGPPPSTWVAAYAMGLVASQQRTDGLEHLLTHVRDAASLRAAVRHLEGQAAGDSQLRADARELIEAAIGRIDGGGSPA